MRIILCIILASLFAATAFAADFKIKSTSFEPEGKIPLLNSCDGDNLSPQFSWTDAPKNTKSYVLTLSTPDWSGGYMYLWVLYNIPGDIKELAQGMNEHVPEGVYIGSNWFNETTYRGPCPPDTHMHRYIFTLYAVDVRKLELFDGANIDEVLTAMGKHIIGSTKIVGLFSH